MSIIVRRNSAPRLFAEIDVMTCRCSKVVTLGSLPLIVAIITLVHAQETQDPKVVAQTWLKQRQAEFVEYEFQRESAKPVLLVMQSRSILNWSNPEKGTDLGGL